MHLVVPGLLGDLPAGLPSAAPGRANHAGAARGSAEGPPGDVPPPRTLAALRSFGTHAVDEAREPAAGVPPERLATPRLSAMVVAAAEPESRAARSAARTGNGFTRFTFTSAALRQSALPARDSAKCAVAAVDASCLQPLACSQWRYPAVTAQPTGPPKMSTGGLRKAA